MDKEGDSRMITTQRIIFMVIAMNLLFGCIAVIYDNPLNYDSSPFTQNLNEQNEIANNLNSEDPYSGITNKDIQTENTIGNSIYIGS